MSEKQKHDTYMPSEEQFKKGLATRKLRGTIWRSFYIASIILSILVLIVLFANVINSAFGSIATTFEIEPVELTGEGRSLTSLPAGELAAILVEYEPNRLPVVVRDNMSQVPNDEYTSATLRQVVPGGNYPDGFADTTINEIRDLDNTAEILAEFMALNLSKARLVTIVERDIVALQVVDAWSLWDAIFNYAPSEAEQTRLAELPEETSALESQIAELEQTISDNQAQVNTLSESANENADEIRALNSEISNLQDELATRINELDDTQDEFNLLVHANITTSVEADFAESENPVVIERYHSWIDARFIESTMSSVPAEAGIRTALIGSIIMILIVIAISLPVGVATAIYLEEYAKDNILAKFPLFNINKMIETNVRNLAGVPSIIYGMLGLAIFVRALAPFTSGVAFGVNASPPPPDRIINMMQEPESFELDIELDDRYTITTYTGPGWLSESDAQEIVDMFRRSGTPSASNTGNIPIERIERELANLLDITIYDEIPSGADKIAYSRIASGFLELEALPVGVEQFEAIANQIRRISGFTVSGRTILSAALTLSLLILPVIIINAQEALRAVPSSLREASYGLGSTKWQMIWRIVLPASIPGIMTGTILAISRAIGETAPLIVVGASTFLLTDPTGPFSQFTVLPIQIYQWTARPQGQFQFIAAAAIIVLLSIVLILNAVAIIIRNRFSTRY